MSALLRGDVDGLVAEIRADYEETEAPYPVGQRISEGAHARQRGFSLINAIVATPVHDMRTGRANPAETLRLIGAVTEAVDIIVQERLAQIRTARS